MPVFFVFVGLWLIGWGILLVSLLLRGPFRRRHPIRTPHLAAIAATS